MQRVLVGTAASLSAAFPGQDGEPVDPGVTTVEVRRGDGSVLLAAGTATSGSPGTTRSVALTAAQNGLVDLLAATWTRADGSTLVTEHEMVGGFYFNVAEARAAEASLTAAKYPDADVQAVRQEVEDECERICGRAFVPRYKRLVVSGRGLPALLLDVVDVRAVRSVRAYTDADSYTAFTADELADLRANAATGELSRVSLGVFPTGAGNLVIEVEHGTDSPPPEVKRMSMQRLRHKLNLAKSGIPDKARNFVSDGGGTFRIATASAHSTGSDEVDAVYQRYSMRVPWIA